MADDRSRTCPICLDDVCEVAPEAKREPIFRAQPNGTRDQFVARQGPPTAEATPLTQINTIQNAINGMWLREEQVSSLDCCMT